MSLRKSRLFPTSSRDQPQWREDITSGCDVKTGLFYNPAAFRVGWFMTEQPVKGLKKPLSDLGYIWMFTILTIAGLIMAGVAAVLYVK